MRILLHDNETMLIFASWSGRLVRIRIILWISSLTSVMLRRERYSTFSISFDEGNIVLLFNGFQKKSQKTPRKEIELAKKLRNEYYAEKRK